MLPFFPTPYPDELLYSICARYHLRRRNGLYKHTVQDLFGSKTAAALTLFPSNINHLCAQLKPGSLITPDLLIFKHSLFPMYKPFLNKERAEAAIQYMKNSNTGDPENRLTGLLRYNLFTERTFKYCPDCFVADNADFGEAYWHRDHQHFGVLTCYKHKSLLVDTGLPLASSQNKREFHLLDRKYPPKGPVRSYSENQKNHIRYITAAVHWLLNNEVPDDAINILYRNYDRILIEKKFAHPSSIMSHTRVSKAFSKFYGPKFLELMSSGLSASTDKNWLVKLLKDKDVVTDPLRHILAMRFLGMEAQDISCPNSLPQ